MIRVTLIRLYSAGTLSYLTEITNYTASVHKRPGYCRADIRHLLVTSDEILVSFLVETSCTPIRDNQSKFDYISKSIHFDPA